MKRVILATAIMLLSLSAWADMSSNAGAPQGQGNGPGMQGGSHPCKALKEACEHAGFVKGGASNGNGLFKDCIMPLMHGQAVKNVSVNASDISACEASRERHHEMGQGGMMHNGDMQQNGGMQQNGAMQQNNGAMQQQNSQ